VTDKHPIPWHVPLGPFFAQNRSRLSQYFQGALLIAFISGALGWIGYQFKPISALFASLACIHLYLAMEANTLCYFSGTRFWDSLPSARLRISRICTTTLALAAACTLPPPLVLILLKPSLLNPEISLAPVVFLAFLPIAITSHACVFIPELLRPPKHQLVDITVLRWVLLVSSTLPLIFAILGFYHLGFITGIVLILFTYALSLQAAANMGRPGRRFTLSPPLSVAVASASRKPGACLPDPMPAPISNKPTHNFRTEFASALKGRRQLWFPYLIGPSQLATRIVIHTLPMFLCLILFYRMAPTSFFDSTLLFLPSLALAAGFSGLGSAHPWLHLATLPASPQVRAWAITQNMLLSTLLDLSLFVPTAYACVWIACIFPSSPSTQTVPFPSLWAHLTFLSVFIVVFTLFRVANTVNLLRGVPISQKMGFAELAPFWFAFGLANLLPYLPNQPHPLYWPLLIAIPALTFLLGFRFIYVAWLTAAFRISGPCFNHSALRKAFFTSSTEPADNPKDPRPKHPPGAQP
jgi:hypothetical protein